MLSIALPSWKQEVSECSRHTHQCLTPLSDEARVPVSKKPPSQPKPPPPASRAPNLPQCAQLCDPPLLENRSIFSSIYSVLQGCIIFMMFVCVNER